VRENKLKQAETSRKMTCRTGPTDVPPEIQQLLQNFAPVFEEPTELPPSRAFNHHVPLISGAHPVFTRPYRYPPGLKDEIERQVGDMLAQGLIQPSVTPDFKEQTRLAICVQEVHTYNNRVHTIRNNVIKQIQTHI
jgi:hypothetical protein